MHDETEYPDPDRFLPERFLKNGKLNPAVRDPSDFIFGYGRRCVTCYMLHLVSSESASL